MRGNINDEPHAIVLDANRLNVRLRQSIDLTKNNLLSKAKRVSRCAKWPNSTAANNGIRDTC